VEGEGEGEGEGDRDVDGDNTYSQIPRTAAKISTMIWPIYMSFTLFGGSLSNPITFFLFFFFCQK